MAEYPWIANPPRPEDRCDSEGRTEFYTVRCMKKRGHKIGHVDGQHHMHVYTSMADGRSISWDDDGVIR